MRILLFMGGNSPERNVSLKSGEAVADGLDRAGHQVLKMDPADPDKVYTMIEKVFDGPIGENPVGKHELLDAGKIDTIMHAIKKYAVDLVFPMLHGGWGEDGRLQALFEIADIPFVGSGYASSAFAMNKHLTKRTVSSEGILTPEYYFVHRNQLNSIPRICKKFGYPLVIKPNASGSTVGLSILKNAEGLEKAIEMAAAQDDDVLVERYIAGRELTVGILEGHGMSLVEIVTKDGFYDYRHKYTEGQTDYICPAELNHKITSRCLEQASIAFQILGCEVYGRVDFRLGEDGKLYFLEVNTIPGMTEHSLVPKSAEAVGISFKDLVNRLVIYSMNLKR